MSHTPEEEAVTRINDARKALQFTTQAFKSDLKTWQQESHTILEEIRLFRMSTGTEIDKTLSAFGDVRKFFLSADHTEELRRLREFVELCERLQKLKDSGFLDKVSDTILKLEKV